MQKIQNKAIECQTDSREADGAPITGFVPEDFAALVTLAQK
jgi:hypothetical protein